jgi:hypothetical protein
VIDRNGGDTCDRADQRKYLGGDTARSDVGRLHAGKRGVEAVQNNFELGGRIAFVLRIVVADELLEVFERRLGDLAREQLPDAGLADAGLQQLFRVPFLGRFRGLAMRLAVDVELKTIDASGVCRLMKRRS